ncbi:hypothetical protein [Streptomyces sp. NRRL S-646]|uniref:hypothetical protein n=1 Tax=Streptomyces sp. NRRL S-646 TaxID=1463917 RepID=UPI000B160F07|nr:hypothetical protein [Streptomyces sp. NRRL S-646]
MRGWRAPSCAPPCFYNPWGQTTWVSEDDFVNGHMVKASDNRMPDAYAVHLPADR